MIKKHGFNSTEMASTGHAYSKGTVSGMTPIRAFPTDSTAHRLSRLERTRWGTSIKEPLAADRSPAHSDFRMAGAPRGFCSSDLTRTGFATSAGAALIALIAEARVGSTGTVHRSDSERMTRPVAWSTRLMPGKV